MMVAFALVTRDALFGVPLRSTKLPGEAERAPAKMMGLDQEIAVTLLLS